MITFSCCHWPIWSATVGQEAAVRSSTFFNTSFLLLQVKKANEMLISPFCLFLISSFLPTASFRQTLLTGNLLICLSREIWFLHSFHRVFLDLLNLQILSFNPIRTGSYVPGAGGWDHLRGGSMAIAEQVRAEWTQGKCFYFSMLLPRSRPVSPSGVMWSNPGGVWMMARA